MKYEYNKENFDKLMNEFVNLNVDAQRDKIIEDLKFLISYESKLCLVNGTNFELIYNKEIGDLKLETVSEKDFLEAVYAFLYILKSSHYTFINSLIDILDETLQKNPE